MTFCDILFLRLLFVYLSMSVQLDAVSKATCGNMWFFMFNGKAAETWKAMVSYIWMAYSMLMVYSMSNDRCNIYNNMCNFHMNCMETELYETGNRNWFSWQMAIKQSHWRFALLEGTLSLITAKHRAPSFDKDNWIHTTVERILNYAVHMYPYVTTLVQAC